jgi:hypothetical protein
MPRISPDQLPTPFTPAPPPEWPPAPAWPPTPPAHAAPPVMVALQRHGPGANGRPKRSVAVLALSGLAVVALGALGAWAIGGDDGSRRDDLLERDEDRDEPDTTDRVDDTIAVDAGADDGSTLSGTELDAAYATLFGVVGSPATLDCVAAQMAGNDDALRLAQMASLSVTEAQSGFTPFVACAPDADFLALIVPATVEVLGSSADANCIGSIYLTFGIEGRAEARALTYADQQQFIDRLLVTFGQCVV